MEPDLRTRFQGTWAGCLGGAMEEVPYLGLIQATRFGDMEIIARHVLSPEEFQEIAHCPGRDFEHNSIIIPNNNPLVSIGEVLWPNRSSGR